MMIRRLFSLHKKKYDAVLLWMSNKSNGEERFWRQLKKKGKRNVKENGISVKTENR
jgi:hypothetical protein